MENNDDKDPSTPLMPMEKTGPDLSKVSSKRFREQFRLDEKPDSVIDPIDRDGNIPAGFEIRDGVLMTEDSDCILSSPRQAMLAGTIHGNVRDNGIFAYGETAKRVLTGMELDLSNAVTEDASLQPLADSLRNGRYTTPYTGETVDKPRHDHRRALLAISIIAGFAQCKDRLSFNLVYLEGQVPSLIEITAADTIKLAGLANEVRRDGCITSEGSFSTGLLSFIATMTHTLNEAGTGFVFTKVEEVSAHLFKLDSDNRLEKFKKSFQNILTMLGYGDEVRFEVVAPPVVCLGGTRVKVEFICDEPPVKMYEAINPAIFEHEWIDCGEIGRIEARLSEAALRAGIEAEKDKPLATRIIDSLEKEYVGSSDGFLKPDAVVPELRTPISPKAINEAMWSHVPNLIATVLRLTMTGSFGTSPIMGKVKFVSHESALAMKHQEKDAIAMEVSLPYEAAYMMFAKEILEEILNTPHFPFYIRDFVQYSHPATHHDNVIAAVAPIIGKILRKKGPTHVTDKELYDLIKHVVAD